MKNTASEAIAVTMVLNRLARDDRGRLLSALISRIKDFQLAEDCLQEAMISAASHWSRTGPPASPKGWLLQVAYRKAIDHIRKRQTAKKLSEGLMILSGEEAMEEDYQEIPDERLRLIFTCCHPALEAKSQVALTLRTICGLSTVEIARAFLDQDSTMGQRLSRAKAKIAAAGIPYVVPDETEWPARLASVLTVIYLVFNAGYSAGPGESLDLAGEAIYLTEMLDHLRPDDPEIEGFLAMLRITHARRDARMSADGTSVVIAEQDRSLWKSAEITEGVRLLERALGKRSVGPFQIKAAIAACHCEGPASDWPQIAMLYEQLLAFEPTSVVRLNRAVARWEAGIEKDVQAELDELEASLSSYQPYHAVKADLHARSGDKERARAAYLTAIEMAASPADAALLRARLARLG